VQRAVHRDRSDSRACSNEFTGEGCDRGPKLTLDGGEMSWEASPRCKVVSKKGFSEVGEDLSQLRRRRGSWDGYLPDLGKMNGDVTLGSLQRQENGVGKFGTTSSFGFR
jgi:hypothetical protein